MKKSFIISLLWFFLSSCTEIEPIPIEPSPGHIDPKVETKTSEIPQLVESEPLLPAPQPAPDLEKYTVVVNEVPVRELLFALSRDAEVNVDIAPGIEGQVTLNAVEQTLPQILDRISRQVDIRYEFSGDNLLVSSDEPFFRSYKVDYVNMARDTESEITIATQIATTGGAGDLGDSGGGSSGGGNNNSLTDVKSVSKNNFWGTLTNNILAIIGEEPGGADGEDGDVAITNSVIPSPETGVLTVKASSKEHELIQGLIDRMTESANRQVLVQATIVEVTLNDRYQAGIDWTFLDTLAGLSFTSVGLTTAVPAANLLGAALGGVITYSDTDIGNNGDSLTASVSLLEEFGNTKVLSSPQLMVLNNQTAVLKVVDNVVFFTIEQETNQTQGVQTQTFETTIHTVPVGIIMSLTPFISDNDSVILNVRPTISRISRTVNDPNPALTVANPIPEIRVREMESMLRMNNGQIGVLGGLMQDESEDLDRGIPGASKIPFVEKLFTSDRIQNSKTELVIFLRPVVVRAPSVDDGDLQLFKPYLESQTAVMESGDS